MKPSKRILLAEDDPKDAELTISALREYDLKNHIMVVRDGVETLDYLYRRERFAHEPLGNPILILLDLKMPKLDGIQVLRQIKGDEILRTIPVVILTSSREAQDLAISYQLGANAYVVKPVKFKDFIAAVREIAIFWALINEPPPSRVG
jgi:CheY-like chemotaxis protein